MIIIRAIFLSFFFLNTLTARAVAPAQKASCLSLPGGSYNKSCSGCELISEKQFLRLKCRCNRIPFYFSSQEPIRTSLKLPCGPASSLTNGKWDIANSDGRLMCKAPPPSILAPFFFGAIVMGVGGFFAFVLML